MAEDCTSLLEVANILEKYAKNLREMKEAGLELKQPVDNGFICISTKDEALADRFEFAKDDEYDDSFNEDECGDDDSLVEDDESDTDEAEE
jgi:hypothetical protein